MISLKKLGLLLILLERGSAVAAYVAGLVIVLASGRIREVRRIVSIEVSVRANS